MFRSKRLVVAALTALVAALALSSTTAAAPSATVQLKGVKTTLTTDPATTAVLLQNRIVPLPVRPGSARPTWNGGLALRYAFPITGGAVDANTLAGEIRHRGGIRFLNLRNGKSLRLNATDITRVQRVPDGFVVVEHRPYEKQRAWYVRERTGDQMVLLDGVRSVVVAGDGSGRLAWLDGSVMRYQESVFSGQPKPFAAVRLQTDRPAFGAPVALLGDAVLLADVASGRPGKHDLWFPDKGDYEPTWAGFFAVYGARARGTELVIARYTTKQRVCLELVPAQTLASADGDCRYLDRRPSNGWVSPSGRWLVVADERQAQMIDLSDGWRTGMVVPWGEASRVGGLASGATWLDQDTLAVHTTSGLMVLSPLASSKAVEYKLPVQAVIVNQ